METEFPSPIGSILGAAVKVAPWISRRQYTDIGFGPGAMGATSDMARRIVHDYKIYRLDPRTGRPDYWNGPPFNSSLPEAVREPGTLIVAEDKQDLVRDLRSLTVNHNLKIRLVLVTAAVFEQQWKKWLDIVGKDLEFDFELRALRDGETEIRDRFLNWATTREDDIGPRLKSGDPLEKLHKTHGENGKDTAGMAFTQGRD